MALDAAAFTTIWGGGTSSDANTAGNWPGGSATGVPVDNSVVGILGSAATLGRNITFSSSLQTVQATLLYIDPTFPYQIGTSANRCNIDAVTVIHRGSGKLYFKTGDVGTTNFIIDCPNNQDAFDIDTSGTNSIVNLHIIRGSGTLGGTLGITGNLIIGSHDNPTSDVNLTISAGHGTTVAMYQNGGNVLAAPQTITTCVLNQGNLVKTSTTSITTFWQFGGYCSYESTGTVTTGRIYKGQFDATKNRSATVIFTDMWLFGSRTSTIYNADNRLVVHTNGPHDERASL